MQRKKQAKKAATQEPYFASLDGGAQGNSLSSIHLSRQVVIRGGAKSIIAPRKLPNDKAKSLFAQAIPFSTRRQVRAPER